MRARNPSFARARVCICACGVRTSVCGWPLARAVEVPFSRAARRRTVALRPSDTSPPALTAMCAQFFRAVEDMLLLRSMGIGGARGPPLLEGAPRSHGQQGWPRIPPQHTRRCVSLWTRRRPCTHRAPATQASCCQRTMTPTTAAAMPAHCRHGARSTRLSSTADACVGGRQTAIELTGRYGRLAASQEQLTQVRMNAPCHHRAVPYVGIARSSTRTRAHAA
jgi:hypothetical protein